MKKVVFFMTLLVLLINVNALEIKTINITIENSNGAYCYNKNDLGFIKTDTIIKNSTTIESIPFEILEDNNKYYVNHSGCYLDTNDLSIYINERKTKIEEINKTGVVLDNYVIEIKRTPNDKAETITTISNNDIFDIKFKMFVPAYDWYYISYNDYKGWIKNDLNSKFGIDNDQVLITLSDSPILSTYKWTNLGTIPAYTEIEDYVEVPGRGYYVNYNGIRGIIRVADYKVNGKLQLNNNAKLYKDRDGKEVIKECKDKDKYDFIIDHYEYENTKSQKSIYIPSENGWFIFDGIKDILKENNYLYPQYKKIKKEYDIKLNKTNLKELASNPKAEKISNYSYKSMFSTKLYSMLLLIIVVVIVIIIINRNIKKKRES